MSEIDEGRIPEDLKEIVKKLSDDAEDMELRLAEYKFLHSSKMLGVAVGGALFIVGLLFALAALFLLTNTFNLAIRQEIRVAIAAVLGLVSGLQLLSGSLLIGK